MQELTPWFRPSDVVIIYLRDVEGYTFHWGVDTEPGPERMAYQLIQMGFPEDFVLGGNRLSVMYNTSKDQLRRAKNIVANHTPQHARVNNPPVRSSLREITMRVPGPITREFTVVDEMIPPTIMDTTKWYKDEYPCAIARIEFFYNKQARRRLMSLVWVRLRNYRSELASVDSRGDHRY
jgi:hypothetical protein